MSSAFCPSQYLPGRFEEGLSSQTGTSLSSRHDRKHLPLARPLLGEHQLLSRARGKQVKKPCQVSNAVLKILHCRSANLGHHRCPIIHKPSCCVFTLADSRVEFTPFGAPE